MQERTIILVGYGNMGRSLCAGWIKTGLINPHHIYVIEPNPDLLSQAKEAGLSAFQNLKALPEDIIAHCIFFAIKPQVFDVVVPPYARFAKIATFVSILAGVSMAKFAAALGNKAAIIRTMPNIPAALGEGMLAVCDNGLVDADDISFVETLLTANGAVARVAENQMDAVTALSGSGPAYVFYLIECLAKAGEAVGLAPETSLLLARQTVKGAGVMAALSDAPAPACLRKQVTSPGGTTQAGLEILMQAGSMEKMMIDCIKAARERSIDLGKLN